MTEDSEYP